MQTFAIIWAAVQVVGKAKNEFEARGKLLADCVTRLAAIEQWREGHNETAAHWISRIEGLERTVEREFERVRDRLDQALDSRRRTGPSN